MKATNARSRAGRSSRVPGLAVTLGLALATCGHAGTVAPPPSAATQQAPAEAPRRSFPAGSALVDGAAFVPVEARLVEREGAPWLAFRVGGRLAPIAPAPRAEPAACAPAPEGGVGYAFAGASPPLVLALTPDGARLFSVPGPECWRELPLVPPDPAPRWTLTSAHETVGLEPAELALGERDEGLAGLRARLDDLALAVLREAADEGPAVAFDEREEMEAWDGRHHAWADEEDDTPEDPANVAKAARRLTVSRRGDVLVLETAERGSTDPSEQGGGTDYERQVVWRLAVGTLRTLGLDVRASRSQSGDGAWDNDDSRRWQRVVALPGGELVGSGETRENSSGYSPRPTSRVAGEAKTTWRFAAADGGPEVALTPDATAAAGAETLALARPGTPAGLIAGIACEIGAEGLSLRRGGEETLVELGLSDEPLDDVAVSAELTRVGAGALLVTLAGKGSATSPVGDDEGGGGETETRTVEQRRAVLVALATLAVIELDRSGEDETR